MNLTEARDWVADWDMACEYTVNPTINPAGTRLALRVHHVMPNGKRFGLCCWFCENDFARQPAKPLMIKWLADMISRIDSIVMATEQNTKEG